MEKHTLREMAGKKLFIMIDFLKKHPSGTMDEFNSEYPIFAFKYAPNWSLYKRQAMDVIKTGEQLIPGVPVSIVRKPIAPGAQAVATNGDSVEKLSASSKKFLVALSKLDTKPKSTHHHNTYFDNHTFTISTELSEVVCRVKNYDKGIDFVDQITVSSKDPTQGDNVNASQKAKDVANLLFQIFGFRPQKEFIKKDVAVNSMTLPTDKMVYTIRKDDPSCFSLDKYTAAIKNITSAAVDPDKGLSAVGDINIMGESIIRKVYNQFNESHFDKDILGTEGSLGNVLSKNMNILTKDESLEDMKKDFISSVEDSGFVGKGISNAAFEKFKTIVSIQLNKQRLASYISNVMMKSAGMGMDF